MEQGGGGTLTPPDLRSRVTLLESRFPSVVVPPELPCCLLLAGSARLLLLRGWTRHQHSATAHRRRGRRAWGAETLPVHLPAVIAIFH